MKKDTKSQILEEAIRCFNQNGYGAVTLHEIAQNLEMTRGNLIYHFKDKDTLLQALVREMWLKVKEEKERIGMFPSFQNLLEQSKAIFNIQKKYAFIFLDSFVMSNPKIHKQFQTAAAKSYSDMKAAIAVSIQMGNLKAEEHPGTYNNIAYIIWVLTAFWLNQEIVKGEEKEMEADKDKVLWSILLPHFTEKGKAAFIKSFGEEYYNSLGESFQPDISSLIGF